MLNDSIKTEPYCCEAMEHELLHGIGILDYNSKLREYGIKIPQSSVVTLINYCMFCGIRLPLSLRDEWFDILENEYGLISPLGKESNKIFVEFLSDEWWKKRGL